MARVKLRETVACAAAFTVGSLAGFLGVAPALFADGPMTGRVQILVATLIVYLILGVSVGSLAPHMWKASGFNLVLPLLPITALFGKEALRNSSMMALMAAFLLGGMAMALGGALLGARWALKRQPDAEPFGDPWLS